MISNIFHNAESENKRDMHKNRRAELTFCFGAIEPYTENPIVRELAIHYGAKIVFRPKIIPFDLLKSKIWQFHQQIRLTKPSSGKKTKNNCIGIIKNAKFIDGVQLLVRDDDPIKNTVNFLSENADKLNIQFIDLNFSCPGYKILPHNRGGELLKYPNRIKNIVEKVLKYSSIPVSVKIRKGYTSKDNPKQVCKILKDFDLAWVTINRAPVKRGSIDPISLKNDYSPFIIAENVVDGAFPLIANGDLDSCNQIDVLLKKTNIKAIMISRSALGFPYIFSKLIQSYSDPILNSHSISNSNTIKDQIFSNNQINSIFNEIFEILFKIADKYSKVANGYWISISQMKNILIHFIRKYYLLQNATPPAGYGINSWKKKKFSYKTLAKSIYSIFNFIPEKKWLNWLMPS